MFFSNKNLEDCGVIYVGDKEMEYTKNVALDCLMFTMNSLKEDIENRCLDSSEIKAYCEAMKLLAESFAIVRGCKNAY